MLLAGLLTVASPLQAQTPVAAGYRDFSYAPTGNSTPTGEKPESKLWWNDGFWWASLWSEGALQYRIFRLDPATQAWMDTGTPLDNRSSSKADVLWDEASQHLYVVSHVFTTNGAPAPAASNWGRLYRYSYEVASQTYSLDVGFPVTITMGKAESLTVAMDRVGRLWVTYVESGQVMINHSLSSDVDWGAPSVLPVDATAVLVDPDDVSAIIAFGGDRIGVMWSNQRTQKLYFTFRWDMDPVTIWQPIETLLPGFGCSGACVDDHINMKADHTGRVVAAVKTSQVEPDKPLVMVLVRNTSAKWNGYKFGVVRDDHTRPIILLDEEHDQIYGFAPTGAGGTIYVKSTKLSKIAFPKGLGTPFIHSDGDAKVNNPTSTHQSVGSASGILVMASDQDTNVYLHNILALGASAAPTISSFTPTSGPIGTAVSISGTNFAGTTAVTFNNKAATFSVGPFGTTIATTVPTGATTGRIKVTKKVGTVTSATDFLVTLTSTTPAISSFTPASGVRGTLVTLTGINFTGTTGVTFGGKPAAFTVTSGTTIDATVPEGATTGKIGVTNPAGTGLSLTDFTVTSDGTIKAITFEGGSLTHPTTGAETVIGTVTLESAAPIHGTYSARVPNVGSSYLEQRFTATDDLYESFYVRLNALPAGDVRLVLISNAGASVGSLLLRSTGQLRLRANSVTVGDSAPLAVGQPYRIGIHQKKGSGADAVLEGFLASGTAAFSAPFAATSTGDWTTAADRLRVGATTAVALDVVVDDIRLSSAFMPLP